MARTANLLPANDPTRKSKPWWISIPPKLSETGKRQKRFFATKAEAEGEIQRLKVRRENHGIASKLLSPADEAQAASAIKLLRGAGLEVQLSEVVGDYLERHKMRKASRSLAKAWAAYLEHKKRSERHEANLRRTLRRFEPLHEVMVSDISQGQIEKVLKGAAATYRNVMLREARAVFTFAMRKGWAIDNPASKVDTEEHAIGEREIYTPGEVEAVLREANATEPELLPYLAVALFAGIRPDAYHGEMVKLEWAHVDLEEKSIDLPASITKKKRRRSIPIEPVLADWLQHCIVRNGITAGRVCPAIGTQLRDRLRGIFERAGVLRKQDATRHSFASYWLAEHRNEDELALRLGHSGGTEILHRHYHRATSTREAKKFWSLTPANVLTGAKVISIRQRAVG